MQKKAFYKIYHSFIIKILNNLSVEEMYFKILKAMYDKSITNIILKRGKQNFPLKSGAQQGYPLLLILLNTVLEVLTRVIKKNKILEN